MYYETAKAAKATAGSRSLGTVWRKEPPNIYRTENSCEMLVFAPGASKSITVAVEGTELTVSH